MCYLHFSVFKVPGIFSVVLELIEHHFDYHRDYFLANGSSFPENFQFTETYFLLCDIVLLGLLLYCTAQPFRGIPYPKAASQETHVDFPKIEEIHESEQIQKK